MSFLPANVHYICVFSDVIFFYYGLSSLWSCASLATTWGSMLYIEKALTLTVQDTFVYKEGSPSADAGL